MIVYFDTSAFVPIVIEEPSTEMCRLLWNEADVVVSSRLLYVETAAALAGALHAERISSGKYRSARRAFDLMWDEMEVIEVDHQLSISASDMARRFRLRGYDAVHCASAQQVFDDELIAISGDSDLLRAWARNGIATVDSTRSR